MHVCEVITGGQKNEILSSAAPSLLVAPWENLGVAIQTLNACDKQMHVFVSGSSNAAGFGSAFLSYFHPNRGE